MAKKMVAKVNFDDGTNKGSGKITHNYKVGDEYLGDAAALKVAKAKGLVCSEEELVISKSVVDEKDQKIADLQKAVASAEALISDLQAENEDLKKSAKKKTQPES